MVANHSLNYLGQRERFVQVGSLSMLAASSAQGITDARPHLAVHGCDSFL